jgi:hypothetical protein
MELDYFKLHRDFWNFAFENPDKIKPNHCALYLFAIEHCNRLGWKQKFGLPSQMTKEAIGIKSHNTYIKTLNDLVEWGFINLIEKSSNQYSANIIALLNFNKAHYKALDRAFIKHNTKHSTKQSESTVQSIDNIDKQVTNIQVTNIQRGFNFKLSLTELGVEPEVVAQWLQVRKNGKATNTQIAFNKIAKQIKLCSLSANECIIIAVEKSWKGFEAAWVDRPNSFNTKVEIKRKDILL